jgi:hypothetical protein
MYQPVGIQALSNAQIKKLLMGGRIRVKSGSDLKLSMVKEHAKKLASASKKGAGMMIQLDPYACDLNRDLEGCGVGSKIKAGIKKVGKFVKANKEAFRPLASSLKQAGRDKIAEATMYALDQGVDPALVSAYSQLAQEAIPGNVTGGSLKSFSRGVTKFVRSPAVKTVRKALRPLAQHAFESAQDVAMAGIDSATQQALGSMSAPTGGSLKSFSRGVTRFVRSPAVRTVRTALRPLAQHAFESAQDVAMAGIDSATQQALAGMGVVPRSQLRKIRAGGALFPAGF